MLVHAVSDPKKIEKIVKEGIAPSSVTGQASWAIFLFVFLQGDSYRHSFWGNFVFSLDDAWIEKNKEKFMEYSDEHNEHIVNYRFRPYEGSEEQKNYTGSKIMRERNQILYKEVIPLEAINGLDVLECSEQVNKMPLKEILKNIPKHIEIIIHEEGKRIPYTKSIQFA